MLAFVSIVIIRTSIVEKQNPPMPALLLFEKRGSMAYCRTDASITFPLNRTDAVRAALSVLAKGLNRTVFALVACVRR